MWTNKGKEIEDLVRRKLIYKRRPSQQEHQCGDEPLKDEQLTCIMLEAIALRLPWF